MYTIWYVTQGLNWTLNIQYSMQTVVIEKAYLNINQVCLLSFFILHLHFCFAEYLILTKLL